MKFNSSTPEMPYKLYGSEIIFQAKFANNMGLLRNPQLEEDFRKAIKTFNKFKAPEAKSLLKALRYGDENQKEEYINKLGFTCNVEDPEFVYIPPQKVLSFQSELRYQYTKVHPWFLKVDDNPAYHEELEALKKATGHDVLLVFIVVENLKKVQLSDEQLKECMNMLDSPETSFYGLKKLYFRKEDANILLPYSKEIGKLYLAISQFQKEEQTQAISYDLKMSQGYTPFGNLANELREKGVVLPDTCEPDENDDHESGGNSQSSSGNEQSNADSEKLLQNINILEMYIYGDSGSKMKALEELLHLGFDLNKIVGNSAEIQKVIDAKHALDKTTDALSEFQKALAQAKENLDKAKKSHENAYVNLTKVCKDFVG